MGRPHSFLCMHWDHEPIRFGPRAVPARSGRAKTRAGVIFQGCWRGPHAATGDRGRGPLARRGSSRGNGRFMESPLSLCACIGTMNLCGPCQRVRCPAFRRSGPAKAGTPNARFMESPDAFSSAHWDHEPDNAVGARRYSPKSCGSQTRAPGRQVHGKNLEVFR